MKVSLVVGYHLNNAIFDIANPSVNRDDSAYSFWLLRHRLKEQGIELSTHDLLTPSEADFTLCFDTPRSSLPIDYKNAYLFLFESEVIKPRSWLPEEHKKYLKVFTWHDGIVDDQRYFKFNYCHRFPDSPVVQLPFAKKRFCTLISANKDVSHPFELYSQRVNTIRWFERNAASQFDLYGVGWDRYSSKNRYIKAAMARAPRLSRLIAPRYPSYRGPVESKSIAMRNYKFAVCYENAHSLPGYITEKIFDCFFAGCVPVYWGAPNIGEHIPSDCYIDRRNFRTHEELYSCLRNITEEEYLGYQSRILDFLNSAQASPFRAEAFADLVVGHLLDDLGR